MAKKVLLESDKIWADGIAEGEIIHLWQLYNYVPNNCRFMKYDSLKLVEYAKENPVILVIDTPFNLYSQCKNLAKYCKGFIVNEILDVFKNDMSLLKCESFLKDKPIMSASALGLYLEELENIKENDLEQNEQTEWYKKYYKKHNKSKVDLMSPKIQLYLSHPDLFNELEKKYSEKYPFWFLIKDEQDGEIHYILYKDEWSLKHDSSKIKLPEGTMVRLECKDGKATVYESD